MLAGLLRPQRCTVTGPETAVLAAARAWVQGITSYPSAWAGDEDQALIDAVTAVSPGLHTRPGAHWCPTCGNCTCPMDLYGTRDGVDPACPICGTGQRHTEGSRS